MPRCGVSGLKRMHSFILNRSGQTTLREVAAVDVPPANLGSPFPQNNGNDSLPLSLSLQEAPIPDVGGRLLGGHLVKPMLFTPFFPHCVPERLCLPSCDRELRTLHNWWFYST